MFMEKSMNNIMRNCKYLLIKILSALVRLQTSASSSMNYNSVDPNLSLEYNAKIQIMGRKLTDPNDDNNENNNNDSKNNEFGFTFNEILTNNNNEILCRKNGFCFDNNQNSSGLHSESRSNNKQKIKIPSENPLSTLKKKQSNLQNGNIPKKLIDFSKFNKDTIQHFQSAIFHNTESYITKFIQSILKEHDKTENAIFDAKFLDDVMNHYNLWDMKDLYSIVTCKCVQNFLQEKIKTNYLFDYEYIKEQLDNTCTKLENQQLQDILNEIVILIVFNNKSFKQFYNSIFRTTDTMQKQHSINEFIQLITSSLLENYVYKTSRYVDNLKYLYILLNDETIK